MRTLLIDNGTSLLEKLQKLVGSEVTTKKWNTISHSEIGDYDLIVLSGSHDSAVVRDHDNFKEEIALIKATQIPLIGICFGCELVAYAFGGILGRLENRREGIKNIHLLNTEVSSKSDIQVFESHRWIITQMPKDFVILAKSEDGPEMIRHQTLPIYGLQFHPENFVNESEGDEMFYDLVHSLTKSK